MHSIVRQLKEQFPQIIKELKLEEEKLKSLIIKAVFLNIDSQNFEMEKKTISLKNLYAKTFSKEIAKILESMERKQILSISFPSFFLKELFYLLDFQEKKDPLITTREERKKKGQYFTHSETIRRIYESHPAYNDTVKLYKKSIIDFSSGLGDFILPIIKNSNLLIYSIELDELLFEYQILKILTDKQISLTQKYLLPLTFEQGDSLKAFNPRVFENALENKEIRKKIILYRDLRKDIFSQKLTVNFEIVKSCLIYREEIYNLLSEPIRFNWFIHFPERFLFDDKITIEKTFDYVVGNPPWNSYSKKIREKYRDIFSTTHLDEYLYGKFNLALPFALLADKIAREQINLLLPLGLFTDSYGTFWRKKIIEENTLVEFIIGKNNLFPDITNEFCIIKLDKNNTSNYFQFVDEKAHKHIKIGFRYVLGPQFLFPLMSEKLQSTIFDQKEKYPKLNKFCTIRRGLTLTSRYQKKYKEVLEVENSSTEKIKPLVKQNRIEQDTVEGIFNFQLWYNNRKLYYDKEMLGAAGNEQLFEEPKIVRRNRGKKFLIGLDHKGLYYVNDIFDIIKIKREYRQKVDIIAMYGYLSSSLVQFISENYLQRDITSNKIRELPCIPLEEDIWIQIYKETLEMLKTKKSKTALQRFRKSIDHLVMSYFFEDTNIAEKIAKVSKIHWVKM